MDDVFAAANFLLRKSNELVARVIRTDKYLATAMIVVLFIEAKRLGVCDELRRSPFIAQLRTVKMVSLRQIGVGDSTSMCPDDIIETIAALDIRACVHPPSTDPCPSAS